MKIYPSPHKVKINTSNVIDTDLELPIAFVNTETKNYDLNYNVSNEYAKDEKTELIPGQSFDTIEIKVFNKYNEPVDISNDLIREGDKYIYRPKNSISFIPQTFLYKATIKKNLEYSSSKMYDINASCIDDPDSLNLSQRLASVLSNPSNRKLLPSNISINKNKENLSVLTTGTFQECEILFIESPNGTHYDDSIDSNKIDYDAFLDNNINIWVACEDMLDNKIYSQGIMQTTEFVNPIVMNNKNIKYKEYFLYESLIDKTGVIYHNIFTNSHMPVLIEEHIGKGFIIYSGQEILKKPEEYKALIYETMIYCHLNSYASTSNKKEWISDIIPDYQIVNDKLIKKTSFNSQINMYKHFKLKSSEMTLVNVEILDDPYAYKAYNNSNNIKFLEMKNGYLIFEKDTTLTRYSQIDPEKPIGWYSVYNDNEIIYVDNIYYLIEETLQDKVFLTTNNNDIHVKISPFKKSSKNLNYIYGTEFVIPYFKTEEDEIKIRSSNYYIYMNNNKIDFCDELDWNEELGDLMFVVNISQNTDLTTVYDMRKLGGGLPEDMEDNYELMDIGHINGRPFRPNSTVVFTLPKKFKQHEELIRNAILKYISAEEYPVIFFENEED